MLVGKVQFISQNGEPKTVSLDVNKTETAMERTQGLLKKPALNSNEGLWISPCNSVHTFGMQYPLDIIYLNSKDQIRKITANLKPRRVSASWFARSVLELQAGTAKQLNLATGDTMKWIKNA